MTAWFLMFSTVMAMSALTHAYSPVKGNVIYLLAIVGVLWVNSAWKKLQLKYVYSILFIFILSTLSALHGESLLILMLPIYFVSALIVLSILSERDVDYFISFLSIFIVLLGALVGTIYAYFGGGALLQFPNPDGRLNQLYLSTLTNFHVGALIRPSGIFDEPGALSFVVCIIAALRHATGKNKKMTWALLLLGVVTSSIAHLLYMIFHWIAEFKQSKNKGRLVILGGGGMFFLSIILVFFMSANELFEVLIFNRLSSNSLGADRMLFLTNAMNYLDIKTFFFGLDPSCAVGLASCAAKNYEIYDSNPLTPLVHWGILISFPYYVIQFFLLLISIFRFNFIAFGVFILLLQRPYVMSYAYALLIMMTVFMLAGDNVRLRLRKFIKKH